MKGHIRGILAGLLFLAAAVGLCPAEGPAAPDGGASPTAGGPQANAAPSVPEAMTDIHDIRDIREPGPDLRPLARGLALLGAVLLAAGWLYRRRRRRVSREAIAPPPPHVAALTELEALSDLRGIDGRRFYFRLSAVLRRYLQARFDIPAPEMTTEELLSALDHPGIGRELAAALRRLFLDAAPVTYAGLPASIDRMRQDLDFAKEAVRQTTPAPEAASGAGKGAAG